jgi:hypothetical protein
MHVQPLEFVLLVSEISNHATEVVVLSPQAVSHLRGRLCPHAHRQRLLCVESLELGAVGSLFLFFVAFLHQFTNLAGLLGGQKDAEEVVDGGGGWWWWWMVVVRWWW